MKNSHQLAGLAIAALFIAASPVRADEAKPVSFNRDIRPILSNNCFQCHGPDSNTREAGLRLDLEEGVFKPIDTGRPIVSRGNPAESELIHRITATDPRDVMPPPASNKSLSPDEIALLKRWIDEGAAWQQHWAYIKPERPGLPEVRDSSWPENEIDRFILHRLEQEGLSPSREAEKVRLVRRLSFDLTGLPPTLEEVDGFLADTRADAYERLVDSYLAKPQFGERMAQHWLDLARYADTNGYHIDNHRDLWMWREWVIHAFNRNLPFDRFTIEQLAGDMLPDATVDQRIASGFHRNTMVNFEGGADPEEYLTKYIVDRVNTTSSVWLGTTMSCAECHDHKYDPFSQKEFYELYAFFHNVPERGLDGNRDNPVPFLKVPTPEQAVRLTEFALQIPRAENALRRAEEQVPPQQASWEKEFAGDANPFSDPGDYQFRVSFNESLEGSDAEGNEIQGSLKEAEEPVWTDGLNGRKGIQLDGKAHVDFGSFGDFDHSDAFSISAFVKLDGNSGTLVSKMDDANAHRGYDFGFSDERLWCHIIHHWPDNNAIKVRTTAKVPRDRWQHVTLTYDGSGRAEGVAIYLDGVRQELAIDRNDLTGTIRNEQPLRVGKRSTAMPLNGAVADVQVYARAILPKEVVALASRPALEVALIPEGQRTEEQRRLLGNYFREHRATDFLNARKRLEELRQGQEQLVREVPATMVMEEMEKPRDTFILIRGDFQSKGDKVTAGVPEVLPPLPESEPANRLTLARWLVSPEHPLTARVTVNRFWQMFFGTGLVATANDFGAQGEWPSHPELLDWLATDFVAGGWDMKQMLRKIVTSATYRQESALTPEGLERDPYNRLLARGPRLRLDAEMIRDNALAVSGLLNPRIGGESVRPYQPPGLWEQVSFNAEQFTAQTYLPSEGEDLFRRGIYVYWKRSLPYPSMVTFDAPNREVCTVQRPVTTTPLQALVLMNDPVYIEAARHLAHRLMNEGGRTVEDRLQYAFRLVLARPPAENELSILTRVFHEQLDNFREDKEAAAALLSVGDSPRQTDVDESELAAWTAVSNVLLNLDETISKS
jgi:hypothetical protein